MEEGWLWYGPSDPVTLAHIRQAGATTLSTALFHVPAGEVWPMEAILERQQVVEEAGLTWTVVESVPVHEVIKRGRPVDKVAEYTMNYCETVRRLALAGLAILSYSFMPLFDWVRTDLALAWRDGSLALGLDMDKLRMWDIHVLAREGARDDYTPEQVARAAALMEELGEEGMGEVTSTILQGLHGQREYTVEEVREEVREWEGIGPANLRANLQTFTRELVEVAEEGALHLSLHPDDPPWGLLGLPTAASTLHDYQQLFEALPSPRNGMTFCMGSKATVMGSLASSPTNHVVDMARRLAIRVRFVHLRNVVRLEQGGLVESGHLEGEADLPGVVGVMVAEVLRRRESGVEGPKLPMRSDHGHHILGDPLATLPGHSLVGRLRGLAEIRGVQAALLHTLHQTPH